MNKTLKVVSVNPVGKRPVYDISEEGAEHYILSNGAVTHNTGIMYSADTVFVITKSQNKAGKDLEGWNFNIGIEKSRFVQEKKRIPITVGYKTGINIYSGLLDIGKDLGCITTPKVGWYSRVMYDENGEVIPDKNWRAKETSTHEFWGPMFKQSNIKESIAEFYSVAELDADEMMEVEGDILKEDSETE